MEQWKGVPNFDGYEVSDKGRVRSFRRRSYQNNGKGHILKPVISNKGYEQVSLYKDKKQYQKSIHRLVAESFIPNPENKRTVNHKNCVKTDNQASNLEWATSSENVSHAYANGLCENVKDSLSKAGARKHPQKVSLHVRIPRDNNGEIAEPEVSVTVEE